MRILSRDIPVARGVRRTRPMPCREMTGDQNVFTEIPQVSDAPNFTTIGYPSKGSTDSGAAFVSRPTCRGLVRPISERRARFCTRFSHDLQGDRMQGE